MDSILSFDHHPNLGSDFDIDDIQVISLTLFYGELHTAGQDCSSTEASFTDGFELRPLRSFVARIGNDGDLRWVGLCTDRGPLGSFGVSPRRMEMIETLEIDDR